MTGHGGGHTLTRKMPSTNPVRLSWGVGLLGLPLLLFVGGQCSKTPAPAPLIEFPDSLLQGYKARLYSYLARSKGDSLSGYRWEIAQRRGDTVYFGISRPARSLYKHRREGVVGRFIPADTGFAYYEELFWTYRFREDTLPTVMQRLLEKYQQGRWDTLALLECCVAFPDKQTRYDTRMRRWVRAWPFQMP